MRRSNDEKSERIDDSELCLLSRRDNALPTRAHCLWDGQVFAHVSKQVSIGRFAHGPLFPSMFSRRFASDKKNTPQRRVDLKQLI